MEKIYLAGGCFWGVERYFQQLNGVSSTTVGYAQAGRTNPTYEEVYTGKIKAVETVEVEYDPNQINVSKLLEHLFRFIDPTTKDRQGADVGSHYRVGVFCLNPEQQAQAEEFVHEKRKQYSEFYFTVEKLENYYLAEDYHQNYLLKNENGYCHVNFGLILNSEKK